jgi:hypothetical protein
MTTTCRRGGWLLETGISSIYCGFRFGSNVDVENMKALLCGLDFDVTVHKNLHLAQFFKQITEFCSNKMHKEADMAVVVILR